MLLDSLKNSFLYSNKYKTNSEAVIISCYFNPQKSVYRTKAFNIFYDSIKHLNHRIIECVIGDAQPELTHIPNVQQVNTDSLLWHKETLLNKVISELPAKYKYVFWVDADVIFTNLNWLVEGVEQLKINNIIQPFEFCVHLEKNEVSPSNMLKVEKDISTIMNNGRNLIGNPSILGNKADIRVWRSFAANCVSRPILCSCEDYDVHGHVGFAWGAKREILDAIPLYDKALIGGADHIIAHAAAGHIPHKCIQKSFTEDINAVEKWSKDFYSVAKGKIGYVKGNLYHIWHGDIQNRQYLQRIKDFTPIAKTITNKDDNGLYIANKNDEKYMKEYFQKREVSSEYPTHQQQDDNFIQSVILGYATNSGIMGGALGGNMAGGILGDLLNNSENNHDAGNSSNFNVDTPSNDIGSNLGDALSNSNFGQGLDAPTPEPTYESQNQASDSTYNNENFS